MTRRLVSTLVVGIFVSVVAGTLLLPARAGESNAAAGADENELQGIMEQLGESFRSLRRSAAKPEQAAKTHDLLQKMELLVVQAKALEPSQAKTLEAAERAKLVKAYQLQMVTLLEKLVATERALLEERHDTVAEMVKEIYTVQRDAHREFRIEDE